MYVRLLRPPFLALLSSKDPIFFIKLCAVTQSPHFFRKIEILTPNDAQFLKFFVMKSYIFFKSGAIFTERSQNLGKF